MPLDEGEAFSLWQEDFAGDLFLRPAVDGRLVLEQEEADRIIADLKRTLDVVADRQRMIDLLRDVSLDKLRHLHPGLESIVADAVFEEQVTEGHLRRTLHELPKYIEALEMAKRPVRAEQSPDGQVPPETSGGRSRVEPDGPADTAAT
ncbi:hypothetical protein [Saccharothrix yanglingensis]|uniref:Uncharacterized protein n=1 Tax=Saccharothrix yanglingensis TaxID=659496 RepID=A0ABU0X785_9PSEU|nr:hypothetical protein [Saccharothrix yanglingensis]MDQ2587983.1 hypothetical protein [Saccharothrix yanglingensis]